LLLELVPQARRPAQVRQELPPPLDNYLRPDLKRGLLSDDEEKIVIDLHKQLGNRSATLLLHSITPNKTFSARMSLLRVVN
jgi:hypothetical protein